MFFKKHNNITIQSSPMATLNRDKQENKC